MEKENDKLNIFLHVDYNYPCKYDVLTLTRPYRMLEDPLDEDDSIEEDYIIVNGDSFVRLVRSEYEKLHSGRFADDCSTTAYDVYQAALKRHADESQARQEDKAEARKDCNTDINEVKETVSRHIEEDKTARVIRDGLLGGGHLCMETFERARRIMDLVSRFISAEKCSFELRNNIK